MLGFFKRAVIILRIFTTMDNWEFSNIEIGLTALQTIRTFLENKLNRCGLMYRIFARTKSLPSLKCKLNAKKDSYSKDGKKVQDMLGFRIIFYFISDVRLFCKALQKETSYIDISDSEKDFKDQRDICSKCLTNPGIRFAELFRPERLNLIFKMDNIEKESFRIELQALPSGITDLIDDTYEVQLRSVLSEGWHEIEHDLRYKCKTEWENFESESRLLNGVFASLESHEHSLEMLFEKKSRLHYQEKNWVPMLRNHLRLRISGKLSDQIKFIFDSEPQAAKQFLKFDRDRLITELYNMPSSYNITFDNIVYLINHLLDNPINTIKDIEPPLIREKLKNI